MPKMIGDDPRYSYQASTVDPRVWVFDGAERIGWLDTETNNLVRFASEDQASAMVAAALKRKLKERG